MSVLDLLDITLPDHDGRWDLRCRDGLIAAIGPHGDSGKGGLDGALVTAAYVDVHHHLDKAFSGTGNPNRSGTLAEAIRVSAEVKRRSTEDEVRSRALRAARMALAHGTVALRTHVDVDPVAELTHVRGVLRAREALTVPSIQVVAFPQEGLARGQGTDPIRLMREAMSLGCDVVGGIPARDDDPSAHVRTVFDLAAEFDAPVDLHVDESDDPDDLTLELVAEETLARGWAGRVTASHCCSLIAQPPARRARIIARVAAAGVHVVTLPSTNLHLQGRGDEVAVRRGLAPVKELLDAGVNTAYGSDNLRDPFNPFGDADMGRLGWLLAHAAHMGGTDDLAAVHAMATSRGAAILAGLRHPASEPLRVGARADLLVFDVHTTAEVVAGSLRPVRVIAGGQVMVERQETVSLPGLPS